MKGYKRCEKGHFYKETLDECNFCPNTENNNSGTEVLDSGSVNNENDTIPTEKTQVFGGGETSSAEVSSSTKETFDPNKTTISGSAQSQDSSGNKVISKRKLRGWLVSFDIEEFGVDFKILEGRNTIGKSSSNDISIQDGQISGSHGVILYRGNKFYLTDELSTNGTKLNGEELVPRDPYELNDGDEIQVGDTNLLFKKAFKN